MAYAGAMIDAALAERPFENHGHDRAVMLKELGRFAVLDGAGSYFASSNAAQKFKELCEIIPDISLQEIFRSMQNYVLRMAPWDCTTATALAIHPPSGTFEYAHAGDSFLYSFDHTSQYLDKLTRDEAPIKSNGKINTDNFLGSSAHELRQWNRLPLSPRMTFILGTDGITDDRHRRGSVSDKTLQKIASSGLDIAEKAHDIVEASKLKDDAAVIVVEYES